MLPPALDVEQVSDADAESGQDVVGVEDGVRAELARVGIRSVGGDRLLTRPEDPHLA